MEERGQEQQPQQEDEQQEQAAGQAAEEGTPRGNKVRSLLEIAGLGPEEQRAQLMQTWRQYELSAVCCRQNVYALAKGKAAYVDALLVRGEAG